MDLQTGKEAASVHLAEAQSERPFDSQLVLRSDGTISIRGTLAVGAWRDHVRLDHGGRVIHAAGRRFAVPDSAAGIAIHQRANGHLAMLEGPDWFWWHDGHTAYALTRSGEGHQAWYIVGDAWYRFAHLDFPWHVTDAAGPNVRDGLTVWRDGQPAPWTFIHTLRSDILVDPLNAWLKRQFTKETTMTDRPIDPSHTLIIELTQGDLTNAEITIGAEHLSRPLTNVVAWIQHTLDGRDLMLCTLGKTDLDIHHIDTEEEALLLHGIIRGLTGGQATHTWLEAQMVQLATQHGWECTKRDRGWIVDGVIQGSTPDPDPEPAPPSWLTWGLGNDIDSGAVYTISAADLRHLVGRADQLSALERGEEHHLDGKRHVLVNMGELFRNVDDAIRTSAKTLAAKQQDRH